MWEQSNRRTVDMENFVPQREEEHNPRGPRTECVKSGAQWAIDCVLGSKSKQRVALWAELPRRLRVGCVWNWELGSSLTAPLPSPSTHRRMTECERRTPGTTWCPPPGRGAALWTGCPAGETCFRRGGAAASRAAFGWDEPGTPLPLLLLLVRWAARATSPHRSLPSPTGGTLYTGVSNTDRTQSWLRYALYFIKPKAGWSWSTEAAGGFTLQGIIQWQVETRGGK